MSEKTRLVSVAPGQDLLRAIERDVGPGAWLQGNGRLDGAQLRVVGESEDRTATLYGPLGLVLLVGPSSGPLSALLARETAAGVETRGGTLVQARSAGVTLAVFAAEGEPAPIEAPAPAGWAARVLATAAAEAADDEPDPEVRSGDIVDHFAFGPCDVLGVLGDRLRIRDIKGRGRIREISLEMLRVIADGESGKKRRYRLLKRGT